MDKWWKTKFNGKHWEAWGTSPQGHFVETYSHTNETEKDSIDALFYSNREIERDLLMDRLD
jgi:hypothetical protein